MHGIERRLMALTLLVAVAAVLVTGFLSRQVVRSEYLRLEHAGPVRGLDRVAVALLAGFASTGDWRAADSILASFAPRLGSELLLVAHDGRPLAASSPAIAELSVEERADDHVGFKDSHSNTVMELIHPDCLEVRDPTGSGAARLFALPPVPVPSPSPIPRGRDPGFLGALDRRFLLIGILAVVLSVWAGRHVGKSISRPILRLTDAARRMEGGDLGVRVPIEGDREIAALSSSFNAMAESLTRAGAARRQLTRDVAHELRTPLTGLQGQIEAMQDGLIPADEEALRSLHQEVDLLSRLVGDLEQLSDSEAGTLRLDLAALPVHGALTAAAGAFAASAVERGVSLTASAPATLVARADAVRLGQMLRNLLANALAHTPRGGHVSLSALEDGALVRIVVEDDGEGIDAAHLPHVFERFYRADPSRTRATGGAGLGLAIVKHLAEAQGGSVSAESARAQGTRMIVTLPRL